MINDLHRSSSSEARKRFPGPLYIQYICRFQSLLCFAQVSLLRPVNSVHEAFLLRSPAPIRLTACDLPPCLFVCTRKVTFAQNKKIANLVPRVSPLRVKRRDPGNEVEKSPDCREARPGKRARLPRARFRISYSIFLAILTKTIR